MSADELEEGGFDAARFERQTRFAPLGAEGQARLAAARVLVVGCGALGGGVALSLARSGVGTLVLVDRDVVELSNLPRQVLFDDEDAREARPKVLAAQRALERIGGPTRVLSHADHLDATNVAGYADGCDLILDGTDNLSTRYLLNDFAVAEGTPWIYGGVVGSGGLVLPVLPGAGACLRCLWPEPPPVGSLETCDTAGVLQPAVGAVSALQAGLALRLLARPEDPPQSAMHSIEVWSGELRSLPLERREDCPTCGAGEFPYLEGSPSRGPRGGAQVFCGRNAVQVLGGRAPELEGIARRVEALGHEVKRAGDLFLRFSADDVRLTVFPDGRVLVEGTSDVDRARVLVDRWIGT